MSYFAILCPEIQMKILIELKELIKRHGANVVGSNSSSLWIFNSHRINSEYHRKISWKQVSISQLWIPLILAYHWSTKTGKVIKNRLELWDKNHFEEEMSLLCQSEGIGLATFKEAVSVSMPRASLHCSQKS